MRGLLEIDMLYSLPASHQSPSDEVEACFWKAVGAWPLIKECHQGAKEGRALHDGCAGH